MSGRTGSADTSSHHDGTTGPRSVGSLALTSRKVLGMAAVVVLLVLAFVHATLPARWAAPELSVKLRAAMGSGAAVERVHVGSSRIYRQVMPALVDSVIGDGRTGFNLGYAATFPPETYDLCHELLDRDRPPSIMVVELAALMLYEERNLDHHKYWYHLGPVEGLRTSAHGWHVAGPGMWDRAAFAWRAMKAMMYNTTGLGLVDHLLEEQARSAPLEVLGPLGDGWFSLEEEARRHPDNVDLQKRRARLLDDTTVVRARAEAITRASRGPRDVSPVHLRMLSSILDKARSKGVKVVLVIPPLWDASREDLLALAASFPHQQVVDLSDPALYPQFYRVENLFDVGHLNDAGSRLFSLELGKALAGAHD